MPCRYDPSPEEIEADRKRAIERERLEREAQQAVQNKLNDLTRMLCEITCRFDAKEMATWKVAGLADWLKEHAEKDARCREKEAKERAAKKKAAAAKAAQDRLVFEELKNKYNW